LTYEVYIVSPAKREIEKFDHPVKVAVLDSIMDLRENPRPEGYVPVVGQKDLYRIHDEDAPKYRIIYCIHNGLSAVIVVTVRLKGKSTYKKIPLKSLPDKIRELVEELPH
jgi:mRNA-degrading endonuclease RelE of RelBE toxin-antitoxin system